MIVQTVLTNPGDSVYRFVDAVSHCLNFACRPKDSNLRSTFCFIVSRLLRVAINGAFPVATVNEHVVNKSEVPASRPPSSLLRTNLSLSSASNETRPFPIHIPSLAFPSALLNQHAPASDFSAFSLEQQPLDPPLRTGMFHVISGWRLIGFSDKGMRTKMILSRAF